jgi:hypothetical protein
MRKSKFRRRNGRDLAGGGERAPGLARPSTCRMNELYEDLRGLRGFRRELQFVRHACEIGQG